MWRDASPIYRKRAEVTASLKRHGLPAPRFDALLALKVAFKEGGVACVTLFCASSTLLLSWALIVLERPFQPHAFVWSEVLYDTLLLSDRIVSDLI